MQLNKIVTSCQSWSLLWDKSNSTTWAQKAAISPWSPAWLIPQPFRTRTLGRFRRSGRIITSITQISGLNTHKHSVCSYNNKAHWLLQKVVTVCLRHTFHRRSLMARWYNYPHARATAIREILRAVFFTDHLHECAAFPLRCLHGPVPHTTPTDALLQWKCQNRNKYSYKQIIWN